MGSTKKGEWVFIVCLTTINLANFSIYRYYKAKTDWFRVQGSRSKGYKRWTQPTLLNKIRNNRHTPLVEMNPISGHYRSSDQD